MARQPRLVLADWPHHIIQRGHNRQPVFLAPEDFQYYLANLAEWKQVLGCRVYAYCLMTNHVHLIVDPGPKAAHLAHMMKRVAGRHTRYANDRAVRTGTLWEGRYKSSPIDTDAYLLACTRYVELNPVRAGMVERPEAYRWSSYRAHVGTDPVSWLDMDPGYLGLGSTPAERKTRYAQWVADGIPPGEWDTIRRAIHRGQLTGEALFVDAIAQKTGRRLVPRGPGRPRADPK
jgi:putative transposase